MIDCVDQVGPAKCVSNFDILKGYLQVSLSKCVKEVASFITSSGLHSYKAMLFSLRNALATFQRVMNRVVAGLESCELFVRLILSS